MSFLRRIDPGHQESVAALFQKARDGWTVEFHERADFVGALACVYDERSHLRGIVGLTRAALDDCPPEQIASAIEESGILQEILDQAEATRTMVHRLPHPQTEKPWAWRK